MALRSFLYVLLFGLTTLATPALAQVRREHPRLYMSETRRDELIALGTAHPDLAALGRYMDRRLAAPATSDTMLRGDYPERLILPAAFTAATLRVPAHLAEVRRYLALLTTLAPDLARAETATRNRLYAMAIGYDWIHDDLTAPERVALANAIVAHVENLATRIDDANYVEGTSRWGNVTALAGALALAGDDARLDARLVTLLDNWSRGYNPALERMGEGGGHPMGWLYGPAYSGVEPYLMWRTASVAGEIWVPSFLRDAAYFHIYGMNAAGDLPLFGDCWAARLQPGALNQVVVSARLFDDGYAESFLPSIGVHADAVDTVEEPDRLLGILTEDTTPSPLPIDTLPLSRLFPGSGFFVIRDQWAPEEATIVSFVASPYYSLGHHHRHEGSFQIDHRGRLLVDGGEYDAPGSTHDFGFYGRSVAHNTLLVSWPDEPVPSTRFPNDGGQRALAGIPHTVEDLDGTFARRGIVGHDDTGACVWVRADLGDTYHPEKVETYVRDVLEVRRPAGAAHPAIFVVDRARLPVARPSAVLWHLAEGVAVSSADGRILASNPGGAHLRIDVLWPEGAVLSEFTGDARWTTLSGTYPPAPLPMAMPPRPPRVPSPYWGRVEVSPPAPTTDPVWAHLLRIGDASLEAEPDAISLRGPGFDAARLGGTLYAVASPDTTELALPDGAALTDGCIAGLRAGAPVVVRVGSSVGVRLVADESGVAIYDPRGTGPTDGGAGDGGESSDAGEARDGAVALDGGAADAGEPAVPAGCSCRTGHARNPGWVLLLSALSWCVIARRRFVR